MPSGSLAGREKVHVQLFKQEIGHPAHPGCLPVIGAHKSFYRQSSGRVVLKPHSGGQPLLVLHNQLILPSGAHQMQLQPDSPQKILGLFQPAIFGQVNISGIPQMAGIWIFFKHRSTPAQSVQIPESAEPFFNVRLEKINTFGQLLPAFSPGRIEHVQKSFALAVAVDMKHIFPPPGIKLFGPMNKAGFQTGGPGSKILFDQLLQPGK